MLTDERAGPPRLVLREPETLEGLIELAQRLLRRHPVAAKLIAGALVAEGRRFAATDEGRRWRSELAASELVRRGRLLWYVGGLDELIADTDETGAGVSDWLALVADALVRTDLEALLNRRLREGGGHATGLADRV